VSVRLLEFPRKARPADLFHRLSFRYGYLGGQWLARRSTLHRDLSGDFSFIWLSEIAENPSLWDLCRSNLGLAFGMNQRFVLCFCQSV
jgi:hypothetical protein